MELDEEAEQGNERGKSVSQGRGWTVRLAGIRYRRFSDLDAGGRPSIFFKFELPPGQTDVPQKVYEILHELKYLPPSRGHNKPCPTGLQFNRSKKHGRVWVMPDNSTGRTAADCIDSRLRLLAAEIEEERGRSR